MEVIINKNESDNNVSLRENNYVQEEIVIDDSNNKEEEKEEVKNISLFDDLIPTSEEKKNNLYQKNVFREMSSRYQTSPIGIVKEEKEDIKEYENDINTGDKDNYLENVYNNLEKAVVPDKIELTDYEKKQEEEAVISYQELIRKKDNINVEDNEEAIISYNELINTKNKLYNITKEEENQEFLSELKKFRNDL